MATFLGMMIGIVFGILIGTIPDGESVQLKIENAALKRALHELAQFDYRLGIDAMRKFAFDALPADTQDIPDRPTPPEPSRT